MLNFRTIRFLALAGPFFATMMIAGAVLAAESSTWRNFSIPVPADWRKGEITPYQATWNFGDMENRRYGFLGFYLSRQSPQEMPLESGAALAPAGDRTLAGRPAKAYDISFPDPEKRYRLIALEGPDAEGYHTFLMAGTQGLSFEDEWPRMAGIIDGIAWQENAPSGPPDAMDDAPAPAAEGDPAGGAAAPLAPGGGGSDEAGAASDAEALQIGQGPVPPGWRTETWKDLTVAIPPDWKVVEDSGKRGITWGQVDMATKKGVMFGFTVENKPLDQEEPEPWMTLANQGAVSVLGHPAHRIEMSGSPEPGFEVRMVVLALDEPDPDGHYMGILSGITGYPWDEHWPTLQKILASLSGTVTAGASDAGASGMPAGAPGGGRPVAMKPDQAWEWLSLKVPEGWKRLSEPDAVAWMSNIAQEPEASLMVMKGEKVKKTLKEMRIDETIPGYLGDVAASVHNGKVSYYEAPVEVWILEKCLPDGSPVGVVLGGAHREQHQGAFSGMLGSIRFSLPEGSGPCDLLEAKADDPVGVPEGTAPAPEPAVASGPAPDPGAEPKAAASGAAGRAGLKRGVADFVAAREAPGPNGSIDTVLGLEVTAPGMTIVSLAMGPQGAPPMWDTLPDNGAWLMGAGRKNTLLNQPDGTLRLALGNGPEAFDLYVQDNHTIAAASAPLALTVTFEDGSVLELPVERPDAP